MGQQTIEQQIKSVQYYVNAFLAEYNMVRNEVALFRQMQGRLDSLALVVLGTAVPSYIAIAKYNSNAVGVILFIPILTFLIAFMQLRHERQMVADSAYIHSHLRSKVNKILRQENGLNITVFDFEDYLGSTSLHPPNMAVQYILTLSRCAISLVGGLIIMSFAIAHYYNNAYSLTIKNYEILLFIIGTLLLLINLVLCYLITKYERSFRKESCKPEIL